MQSEVDQCSCLRQYAESKDEHILEPLVAMHLDAAYGVAFAYFGNEHDAADAVQDALINVMKSAASFRGRSKVRTWILSIVINSCHQKRRQETRLKKRESIFMKEQPTVVNTTGQEEIGDVAGHKHLYDALQELPEHYRMPITLHYIDGMDLDEVASALQKPRATIRKQLRRGLDKVREILPRHGFEMNAVAVPIVLFQGIHLPAAPVEMTDAITQSLSKAASALPSVSGTSTVAGLIKLNVIIKPALSMAFITSVILLTWSVVIDSDISLSSADILKRHRLDITDQDTWTSAVTVLGENPFVAPYVSSHICMSYDNTVLAASGVRGVDGNNQITLWSMDEQQIMKTISVQGDVVSLQYAEDGKRIYYMLRDGDNGSLCSYDLVNDQLLYQRQCYAHYLLPFKIHDKSGVIIAANKAIPWGTLGFMDIDDHRRQADEALRHGAFVMRDLDVVWRGDKWNVRGSSNVDSQYYDCQGLVVYDINTGDIKHQFNNIVRSNEQNHLYGVRSFDLDPSGTKLLCVDRSIVERGGVKEDKTYRLGIWDLNSGTLLSHHILPPMQKNADLGSVQFLSDNQRIFLDAYGAIFNYRDGKIEHIDGSRRGYLSKDRKKIVYWGSNKISTLSLVDKQEPLKVIDASDYIRSQFSDKMNLSPDARYLMFSYKNAIGLIDLQAATQISPEPTDFEVQPGALYAPDGKLIGINGQEFGSGQDVNIYNDEGLSQKSATIMLRGLSEANRENWSLDGRYFLSETARHQGFIHHDLMQMQIVNTHWQAGECYKSYLSPDNMYSAVFGHHRTERLSMRRPSICIFNNSKESPVPQSEVLLKRRQNAIPAVFWDHIGGRMFIGSRMQGDNESIRVIKVQHKQEEVKGLVSLQEENRVKVSPVKENESGAYDIKTGKRIAQFKDVNRETIIEVQLLAHHLDWIYGWSMFDGNAQVPILWNARDLSFARVLPDVGKSPLFSRDGRELAGSNGVVDLETGKWVRKFIRTAWQSPSHRLVVEYIQMNGDGFLEIYDNHQDILLWRTKICDGIKTRDDFSLLWHPGEYAVTMTVRGQALLLQVPLFQSIDYPESLTLEKASRQLTDAKIEKRMQAVSKLRAGGLATLEIIKQGEQITDMRDQSHKRNVLLTLQLLAIDGIEGAAVYLQDIQDPMTQHVLRILDQDQRIRSLQRSNSSSLSEKVVH